MSRHCTRYCAERVGSGGHRPVPSQSHCEGGQYLTSYVSSSLLGRGRLLSTLLSFILSIAVLTNEV